MLLADRVGQCSAPFVVQNNSTGRIGTLDNRANHAEAIAKCPVRYVLADDLTRLCADLAYSKGACTLECADLFRLPATQFWVEWCNAPWRSALQRYGFPLIEGGFQWVGRRGALINATSGGRRGVIKSFWSTGESGREILASSVESAFDLDTAEGERKARAGSLWCHTLGTIARDVPMLLAFLLLLSTRNGLPQRASDGGRLNRARSRTGNAASLEHVVVRAPLLPEYAEQQQAAVRGSWRSPRLHHVRGQLVRRGSELFWRVPCRRGGVRAGAVQSRTVVWTFEPGALDSRETSGCLG
jgi:hypothetical protein